MRTLHAKDCYEASFRSATDRGWVQYDPLIEADRKIHFDHEEMFQKAELKIITYGKSAFSIYSSQNFEYHHVNPD